MISSRGVLMIEPRCPAAAEPVIDEYTRRMVSSWRQRRDSPMAYMGFHTCVCGVDSTPRDHFVLGSDGVWRRTNSLCVHYLAWHRSEVSAVELSKVWSLSVPGPVEPTVDELVAPGARPAQATPGARAGFDSDEFEHLWRTGRLVLDSAMDKLFRSVGKLRSAKRR